MIRSIRLFSLGVIAAAALSLSACQAVNAAWSDVIDGTSTAATVGTVVGATPAQVQAAMDAVKKGLTTAHQAHRAVADTLGAFADAGLIKGANAAKARSLLLSSEAYLAAADKAVDLADAEGAERQLGAANELMAQIHSLLGNSG